MTTFEAAASLVEKGDLPAGERPTPLTVGQIADLFGITVRTLHHYDQIGLLQPTERTPAGYRLYTAADLARLRTIVVYRRLEFSLDQVRTLLDDPDRDVADQLRRQRQAVMSKMEQMSDLLHAIDRALERQMSNQPATEQDMKELFGESFDDYQGEAEQRWGQTEAWKQSQARTKHYTRADWEAVKAETDQLQAAFVEAMRAGEPADSQAAMDAAEAHRQHIDQRFYDCGYAFHKNLAELYVSDPRYTATYDDSLSAPGLAQYVHDAMLANAARHGE